MASRRSAIITYTLLAAIVVGAFALRTAWTIPAAREDGTFVLGESDAYYYKRAVDHAQANWRQLEEDPMLNYPMGDVNPNPPFRPWLIATTGSVAGSVSGDTADTTWWIFMYEPAFWAALCVVPVFLIARRLAGTAAGLAAGFLLATSIQNMNRSHLGFSDHDSMQLFFTVLGLYFVVRALDTAPTGSDPRSPGSVLGGWWPWLRDTRAGAYAVLAGASFGALALVWKGFPYAFGVVLAFSVVQLVLDHGRRRDVSPTLYATATPLLVALVMAAPYYFGFGLGSFITPAIFLAALVVAVGLFLAFAREYPAVLAIPGLAVVGAVAAVVMFFLAPAISRALLSRFVYFKSSVLYTTIAEANPADFTDLAFSIGPFAFFLFFIGGLWLLWRWWKDRSPAMLLVLLWAAIDLYAASSAARFLFTSTPSMAVLAGAATGFLVALARFDEVGKMYRALGGGWHAVRRAVNSIHIIVAVVLAALLIAPNVYLAADAAVPGATEDAIVREESNAAADELDRLATEYDLTPEQKNSIDRTLREVLVAIRNFDRGNDDFGDALNDPVLTEGLPAGYIDDAKDAVEPHLDRIRTWTNRFGAFGANFISGGWHRALLWLSTQDTDLAAADRPASLSWWDYGHWTITVSNSTEGNHPAVADNFQHGYRLSGAFLTSQNETHMLQLLSARLFRSPGFTLDQAAGLLTDAGVPSDEARGLADQWRKETFVFGRELDLDASRALLSATETATGKSIRYFAADDRMLAVDDSSTANIESSGIYYAPVVLSGQSQEAFFDAPLVDLRTGEVVTPDQLQRLRRDPNFNPDAYGQRLFFKPTYFNSFYYRAFIGSPATVPFEQQGRFFPQGFDPAEYGAYYAGGESMLIGGADRVTGEAFIRNPILPGWGLAGFRLVYANAEVRYLEYTPGAIVRGTVNLDGQPLAGVRVTVFDDAAEEVRLAYRADTRPENASDDLRVPHDSTLTDAAGRFELRSVFDTGGQILVRVSQEAATAGPTPVLAETLLSISRDDANAQRVIEGVTFDVDKAAWTGRVFADTDGNGTQEPAERGLANATVRVGDRSATTGPGGEFTLTDLTPGRFNYEVEATGYTLRGQAVVTLEPGETHEQDVGVSVAPVTLSGTATAADGPRPGARLVFNATAVPGSTGRTVDAFADANATFEADLQPGVYEVQGSQTTLNGTYELESLRVVEGTATVDGFRLTVQPGGPVRIETVFRKV